MQFLFFFFFHRLHSDLHVEFLCFVFVWAFGLWVGGLVWFGLGFFINFVLWGFFCLFFALSENETYHF